MPNIQAKTNIFCDTFKGRTDIVPRYWVSRDGQRSGYSPMCRNEWKKGVCQKLEKRKCRDCENPDYIPLSDSLLLDHFKGNHILGAYPLLKDNTCHFIAAYLDNHTGDRSPLKDIRAFSEVCQIQEIPCYALRSKGGNGYNHAYVFFKAPAPAWKARMVIFALLRDHAALEQVDRLEAARQYRMGQAQQAQTNKQLQGAWGEALKEAGLSQEEYNQLFAEDPQGARELMREGMKYHVKTLASKKRGPDGRFLKGEQPQPRRSAPTPRPAARERDTGGRDQARFEELKAKVKTGRSLSSEEEDEALLAVLGDIM